MAVLIEYLPRQSNKANWSFADQLTGSDGVPLWSDIPSDLVVTIVLVDRRGVQQLQVSTNDGSGQVEAEADGVINVNVSPNTLGVLYEGLYDVWFKIVTGTFTIERIYARLPVCEGI